jgi:putative transposase
MTLHSIRTIAAAHLTHALLATKDSPAGLYGRRKMTVHLQRIGHAVSIRTVDRLMRDEGLCGVIRGKNHRATIPAKDGKRANDLLDRDFTAPCPNSVWIADFTYCRTWAGFVYVSFIIDVFSRKIVGWHVMTTRPTELVMVPLRMSLWNRRHEGFEIFDHRLYHSDAGSEYVSLKFLEELMLERVLASIASVGDLYDNSVAESSVGLF